MLQTGKRHDINSFALPTHLVARRLDAIRHVQEAEQRGPPALVVTVAGQEQLVLLGVLLQAAGTQVGVSCGGAAAGQLVGRCKRKEEACCSQMC